MALPLTYNVRNLLVRWKVTLLSIFGVGLVVTVLVVLMSMAAGFRTALRTSGRIDNAVYIQKGSASELTSWANVNLTQLVSVDSRVARGKDGQPLASPEIVIVSNMPRRADNQPTNVTVRGVTQKAFDVRGPIEIIQGRSFTPGLYEIIVGERIHERMAGLDIGSKVNIQKRSWEIVGIFRAEGSAFESEIWGDVSVMGPAFLRTGGYNSLTLRLNDPKSLSGFAKEISTNPQMQHRLIEERKYYEDQAGPVANQLTRLAMFVAVVMGIGAVFGAMNTMYAIVSARTREVGTLRALGFSRFSVLTAFLIESVFLAIVGGLIGCLLALPMNNFSAGTGGPGFSELAYAFKITGRVLVFGMVFAISMGVIGGLLPAIRAARLPISSSLREA
ncbi:MAG: ABC transporter permease [Acidobacteriales bacterium]|nr:ABC transporter permease [Terriglobales bacterium]